MKKIILIFILGFGLWTELYAQLSPLTLGIQKYRQGDLEGAIADFEIVLETDKENAKAKEYLLNCYIILGAKLAEVHEYNKALTFLERASKLALEDTKIKGLYESVKTKLASPTPPKPAVVPQPEEVKPTPPPPKEVAPAPAPLKKEEVKPTPVVPKIEKPVVGKVKEIKPEKITKPALTITEVVLPAVVPQPPTIRKTKIKKPPTLEITEERLKLLEEKIITLSQNYEQERKELSAKLGEKDVMIKRIVLYTFLVLLFFIFLSHYTIRRSFSKSPLTKILTASGQTIPLPDAREIEKNFFNWLNNLENREIVQIIGVLLNSPEENVRAKGFEFLEKIWQTKKFTPEEQWKIERVIRKIGLEEGWITK